MKRILMSVAASLAVAGLAWGQDKEGKPAPKPEAGKDAPKEAGKEGAKGGEKGPGPMLSVAEVDLNGDGWLSAVELKAALGRLGGGGDKEGAKPKPGGVKDGAKEGVREGEGKKLPNPRPDAPKEGERKGDVPREGEKKKEGDGR